MAGMEPAFAFTIPSIGDDTTLDCRLFHPDDLDRLLSERLVSESRKPIHAAIIAHPYAALGGSYDDAVVSAVTACLNKNDFIVGTFNFRGAGDSQGHTSWTGKGESEDYASFTGFMATYVQQLSSSRSKQDGETPISMLLAGYSYGSLVLSHLPPIETILQQFEVAQIGSSAAEVILRAQRLASETHKSVFGETESPPRGRALSTSSAQSHITRSPVTVGGEETQTSERRLSRSSRKSVDMAIPNRIRAHLHSRKSSHDKPVTPPPHKQNFSDASISTAILKAHFDVKYMLISPLLPPLSHALFLPSSVVQLFNRSSDVRDASSGFGSLKCSSLAIYGGNDHFTSSKRLHGWLEKINNIEKDILEGHEVVEAGHFWREPGTTKQLLRHITEWTKKQFG